ncbi:MAG: sensor histidine kinase [Sphingorhabdus sp.]
MASGTIRTKLLQVIFAAVIPLVAIAGWQAYLALDDARALVASRLTANAWAIAERERDPFIIAEHALMMLAKQPDIKNIGSRCNMILADAMRSADGLVNFVRTDANGKVRCSVLPFNENMDVSGTDWWKIRQRHTQPYLSRPEMGMISDQPVMVMAHPLFSDRGTFDGIITASISIDTLKALLGHRNLKSESGLAFVTDPSGKMLIAMDGIELTRPIKVGDAQPRPSSMTADDGSRWTYVSVPLFRKNLYLAYAEPAELTMRSALVRMWPSLLLPLFALLLTSIAVWFATQKLILHWLHRLRRLTARFANGDFRSELDDYKDAPAELAQFATDLHNMARNIDVQEQELRDALAAKTALTKEVNHRVKNNLQIVNSLLTLQADRITDPAARIALSQAKSRIAALGLIHRLLYENDNGNEHGYVDMQSLLNGLCGQLRSAYRDHQGISLDCQSDAALLFADKALPVTLFTVEAVTNAFQHAFDPGGLGSINVTFSILEDEDSAEMRVSDNGRGFVQEKIKGQMGIEFIKAFADQVDGTIDISSPPSGTILTLRFRKD